MRKIAIIGAGLGGIATAIALLKQGFEVQVYERAQSLRPVGAGLTLFPNGLNSLAAIHPAIVPALKQAGSHTQSIHLKNSAGELLLTQPTQLEQQFGQPILNIHWSRLQEILAQFLPSDRIHLAHTCTGFEQSDQGVVVHFAQRQPIQTEVLIGADGLHSSIRQTLTGDGPPRYAGRLSWRSVVPFPTELLPPDTATLITAPNGKNCLLTDAGEGFLFWSATALLPEMAPIPSAPNAKLRVLEFFGDWPEPLPTILQATPLELIVERKICDRPPLKSWSQGSVTLLGDAAHPVVPSMGQGANMAFEDAWELAACLTNHPPIATALQTYETRRIPRTETIYARSAYHGDRAYQADSETVLREVLETSQLSQVAFDQWLYGYNPAQFA